MWVICRHAETLREPTTHPAVSHVLVCPTLAHIVDGRPVISHARVCRTSAQIVGNLLPSRGKKLSSHLRTVTHTLAESSRGMWHPVLQRGVQRYGILHMAPEPVPAGRPGQRVQAALPVLREYVFPPPCSLCAQFSQNMPGLLISFGARKIWATAFLRCVHVLVTRFLPQKPSEEAVLLRIRFSITTVTQLPSLRCPSMAVARASAPIFSSHRTLH